MESIIVVLILLGIAMLYEHRQKELKKEEYDKQKQAYLDALREYDKEKEEN